MATSLSTVVPTGHEYGMHDADWRQTVYDHRTWLLARSINMTFTLPDAHTWRFRLQEFLKAKYDMPISTLWIVLWINELDHTEFDGGTLQIKIPELNAISTLYNNYAHAKVLY